MKLLSSTPCCTLACDVGGRLFWKKGLGQLDCANNFETLKNNATATFGQNDRIK